MRFIGLPVPTLYYKNTSIVMEETQTVLESLEQAGIAIPFSCRAGLCHSCMMQSKQKPPVHAQQGLSENQKAQHLFLACSCIPDGDMEVSLVGDATKKQATVIEKKWLNESIVALFIQTEYRWFPGQYITVWYNDIQGRPYSIASRCEHQGIIELHVKRHAQGLVSSWLHDALSEGDTVTISKPQGDCFYSDDHIDKPLLMAATGTGLAPLIGILKEALAKKHAAPIYLYAAAGDPKGLYYRNELQTIADENNNVHYIATVRRDARDDIVVIEKDLVDLIKERHTDLKGWKIFLCGNEEMIRLLQRHCFFKGATVSDILIDAFTIAST